jgi:hypothetical protein
VLSANPVNRPQCYYNVTQRNFYAFTLFPFCIDKKATEREARKKKGKETSKVVLKYGVVATLREFEADKIVICSTKDS